MDEMVDSNNNTSVGKYSLRPRTAPRRPSENEGRTAIGETRKKNPRTLPLSKHRRRSANARERSRMREINEAFEALRTLVAWSGGGAEKTTKISTLRLAIRYISALTDALQDPGTGRDHRVGQNHGVGCVPTEVPVEEESQVECTVSTLNVIDYPETFPQSQMEIFHAEKSLTSTGKTIKHSEIPPSTMSRLDCEELIRGFEGSSANFQNCIFTLDCHHEHISNTSRATSGVPSSLSVMSDQVIGEPKSDKRNPPDSLKTKNQKNRDSNPNEFLISHYSKPMSSNISNLIFVDQEGHHKSQGGPHVSQFEESTSLLSDKEERVLPFHELFST